MATVRLPPTSPPGGIKWGRQEILAPGEDDVSRRGILGFASFVEESLHFIGLQIENENTLLISLLLPRSRCEEHAPIAREHVFKREGVLGVSLQER
jgi:hypothetical protein